MNWKKYYKFFRYLNSSEADYFASAENASQAISAYNRALKILHEKKDETAAMRLVRAISEDYPMFPEPAHIYAIYLADNSQFKQALDILKRVSLLDITDEMANMLQEQILLIERELKVQEQLGSQAKTKRKPGKKKRESSLNHVLFRTSQRKRTDTLRQSEINILNQQLGNDNPSNLKEELNRERRNSDLKFLLSVLGVALLFFLFFYFFIRPMILSNLDQNQNLSQLRWLEDELTSRAPKNQAIEKLLNDYLQEFGK